MTIRRKYMRNGKQDDMDLFVLSLTTLLLAIAHFLGLWR